MDQGNDTAATLFDLLTPEERDTIQLLFLRQWLAKRRAQGGKGRRKTDTK